MSQPAEIVRLGSSGSGWYSRRGLVPQSTLSRRHVISNRIFVGNLSYETTQDQLSTLFSEAGDVSEVFLPSDRMTGRPRGFAFVEFADASAAEEAIEKFDGYDLGGRALRVNLAEERPARRPPMGGGGGGGGGGGFGADRAPRFPGRGASKGSRRGQRGKKRSL